jgi:hypothetical protein
MREIYRVFISCLICALAVTASFAQSDGSNAPPFQDMHSKDVLRAMDNASVSGHPDQEGEFQGILHYAKRDYAGAMKYFLDGARYADKLSQLCIGLMYLNGNGVRKDPVMAYAWFAIAAERKYPRFVVTRDQTWAQLNNDQRIQATAMAQKLSMEYGDAVAKPRMVAQLRQDMLQGTQSHIGYDDGRVQSYKPGRPYGTDDTTSCAVSSIGSAPISGCNNIFAGDPLKSNQYFQTRDAEWQGTVTVGPIQNAAAPKTTGPSNGQQ